MDNTVQPAGMTEAEVQRAGFTLTKGYGLKNDEQRKLFHSHVDDNHVLLNLIDFELKRETKQGVDRTWLDTTVAATYPRALGPFGGASHSASVSDAGAAFHCRNASTSALFEADDREQNVLQSGGIQVEYTQGEMPDGEFERWAYNEILAQMVANNNEDILINGVYSAPNDAADADAHMLKIQDGLIESTKAITNLLDATHKTASIDLCLDLLAKIHPGWQKDKAGMRFLMSQSTENVLRKDIKDRETGYGDAVIKDDGIISVRSVDVLVVPLWPDNIDNSVGTSSYTNETVIILTGLKNLKWVMFGNRKWPPYITRWYENPATMDLYAYLHRSIDIFVKNAKAMSRAYNLAPTGTAYGA